MKDPPLPPEILADALQDRCHLTRGKLLASTPIDVGINRAAKVVKNCKGSQTMKLTYYDDLDLKFVYEHYWIDQTNDTDLDTVLRELQEAKAALVERGCIEIYVQHDYSNLCLVGLRSRSESEVQFRKEQAQKALLAAQKQLQQALDENVQKLKELES